MNAAGGTPTIASGLRSSWRRRRIVPSVLGSGSIGISFPRSVSTHRTGRPHERQLATLGLHVLAELISGGRTRRIARGTGGPFACFTERRLGIARYDRLVHARP